ncbi:hypothetical protein [Cupriavidus sp. RAF12]|uniref:hypothetical protein n=1 Tax=Cupriavidus sp. RAF12 TaxID=3233050 RepID=UPI003F8F5394
MRARISLTTLKRLERVEQARSVNRPRGEWPDVMGVDEWEAVATEYLAKLSNSFDTPVAQSLVNHNDVTHRYKKYPGELRRGQTAWEREMMD